MQKRGFSPGQLAALAGCTQPAISALVTGKSKRPSLDLLAGVAGALDLSLDELVTGSRQAVPPRSLEGRVAALERAVFAHPPAAEHPRTLDTYLDTLRQFAPDLKSRGIAHVEIFGSAVRGELRPDSDIDILVSFKNEAIPSVFEFVALAERFGTILGRKVDLVDREAVIPALRRRIYREAVRAF